MDTVDWQWIKPFVTGAALLRIGTAGWSLPRDLAGSFPGDGTHLDRYARVFSTAEINSSFYRPHLPRTYARWAASVPQDFSFSIKLPKAITHVDRLSASGAAIDAFLHATASLGAKFACVLVQLPPSLAFVRVDADAFFRALRERYSGQVAVEPRHSSWFESTSNPLLVDYRCARVAADPARVAGAGRTGGWNGFEYWRLHGSPRTYHSSYASADIDKLAAMARHFRIRDRDTWCIFDNTALGAATANALALKRKLAE